jgi:hypothetical protein
VEVFRICQNMFVSSRVVCCDFFLLLLDTQECLEATSLRTLLD